jgi:hypothetical protein
MPEPEKRFTVCINCEGEQFQGRRFTTAVLDALRKVTGGVKTGRFSGAITDVDGKTIGNWTTQWRQDPPVTPPARSRRSS